MIIHLNDQWQVSTDRYNYILEKKVVVKEGENAGKEVSRSVAFYPNLEWCINALLKREICENDLTGVKEVKEHLDRVKEEILRGLGDVK